MIKDMKRYSFSVEVIVFILLAFSVIRICIGAICLVKGIVTAEEAFFIKDTGSSWLMNPFTRFEYNIGIAKTSINGELPVKRAYAMIVLWGIIKTSLFAGILYCLARMMAQIRKTGSFFCCQNAAAIHRIGILLILYTVVPYVFVRYILMVINGNGAIISNDTIKNNEFYTLFPGILVLIFARLFSYGCQIQEDENRKSEMGS